MFKILKFSLMGLSVIITMILGIVFSISEPLNRDPSIFTNAAKISKALIDEARSNFPETIEASPLQVGWAFGDITPPPGTATLGYGDRLGKGAYKNDGPLRATAFSVQSGNNQAIVLLTADLCFWPNHLSAKLAERLSDVLPRQNLFFGATHTHDGPGEIIQAHLLEFMFGAYSEDTVNLIIDGAELAVRESIEQLDKGSVRVHEIPLDDFVINRTDSQQAVSNQAVILELKKDIEGETKKAALITYPAHATIIASGSIVSSANYPGAMSRYLENKGWNLVGFFAAETGQAGPKYQGELAQAEGFELAQDYGLALAKTIEDKIDESQKLFNEQAQIKTIRTALKLTPWQYRIAMSDRILKPDYVNDIIGGIKPNAHIHGFALNELVLIGHGFELSSEQGLKERAKAKEQGKILVPLSFNGEHHFYVVPESAYDKTGYEPSVSFFGPHLADYITEMNLYMIQALEFEL